MFSLRNKKNYLWTIFSTPSYLELCISGRLPERVRKRRERVEESKNVQTTPPAPTASTKGPCPTIIEIEGRPRTESLPRTIAPADHPFHFRSSDLEMDPTIRKLRFWQ